MHKLTFRTLPWLAAVTGVAVIVYAEEHPAPKLKPAETKLELSRVEIEVPKDGVKSKVTALHLPGTQEARDHLESAPPPASFKHGRRKTDLPPPFQCSDTDESGKKGDPKSNCYFTRMPLYNQQNPNLAYVNVPEHVYKVEKHPITGPLEWDKEFHGWAVLITTKDAKVLDPYYASWLPLGPHVGDPASLGGGSVSDTCGPNSESMALMAALSTKTDKVKIKPKSWLEESFLHGKRPEWQEPLPKPLKHDYGTLAPDAQQQSEEELQRVINLAVLQKTDPTAGGGDSDFVTETILKDIEDVDGKHPYQVKSGKWPTTTDLVNVVRERFAPVITLGRYSVTFKGTKDAAGKVTKWTVTLKRTGGHFLAVNGFFDAGTPTEALLIFDPVFANPYPKALGKVRMKGAKTKEGVPIEVLVEGKKGAEPVGETHWSAWTEKDTDLENYKDGKGTLHVIEGWHAIRMD